MRAPERRCADFDQPGAAQIAQPLWRKKKRSPVHAWTSPRRKIYVQPHPSTNGIACVPQWFYIFSPKNGCGDVPHAHGVRGGHGTCNKIELIGGRSRSWRLGQSLWPGRAVSAQIGSPHGIYAQPLLCVSVQATTAKPTKKRVKNARGQ
ncbi:hypothetical protein TW95_gp0876 [Pandoravirus inopinatum]|uniref:Uncharacterized protein n=1 Tax=Pandoravirus inopinatum TaxID=1605721 RepID=A0A0B5J717_9VIRU|nr:hypothetical protein TW95_gp0876 [Pandoravirus inopinatum]AJF97610.1 hypothetical protein [Pandoravirus inopinatum]